MGCRAGECRKQQTSKPNDQDICGDGLPHLRSDFTICTHACIQAYGHRPETPHRCADGHEWHLDEVSRDLRKADSSNSSSGDKGKADGSNRS